MFFDPRLGHSFNGDPFKALVVPRPIAWMSTSTKSGDSNLAPFSFFNLLLTDPAYLMVSCAGESDDKSKMKDTARNILDTREFVVNIVQWQHREKMVQTSKNLPYGKSEFEDAELEMRKCRFISAPRLADSPVSMECQLYDHFILPSGGRGAQANVFIGEVIGMHIDEEIIRDGRIDPGLLDIVGRMGYRDYVRANDPIRINLPHKPK